MSETVTRDLSGAMHNVRRTASYSVTLLKAAVGGRTPVAVTADPANESVASAPIRIDPSVISANTEMTGSITTSDELHVHGKIDGDVRAATITICAGGKIKGDLYAEAIIIHGAVEGRIEGQHVLVCAGAVVSGEIVHGSLGIDTAAVFEGSIKRIAMPVAAE